MSRGMVNLPGIVGLGMILMVGVGCAEETEPVDGAGGLLPEGGESVTTIGDLVINEVVAQGANGEQDWIELYNR